MEHGLPEDKTRIVLEMAGDVLRFSQHKFASNVIEKCLLCGTAEEKSRLITEALNAIAPPTPVGAPPPGSPNGTPDTVPPSALMVAFTFIFKSFSDFD